MVSVYSFPSDDINLDLKELKNILSALPDAPILISGDF